MAGERCLARYDKSPHADGTHTCARMADHDGQHYCPVCRCVWDAPGGAVHAVEPGWSSNG